MNNPINNYCPRSGKAVVSSSLTEYKGHTVGFCNPGCRDGFDQGDAKSGRDKKYFDVIVKENNLGN